MEQKAMQALAAVVRNESIRLSNVRAGDLGSICGEVAVGDSGGTAPRPFIVLPGGSAELSSEEGVRIEDLTDRFAGFYLSLCASREEVERAEQLIKQAAAKAAARELDDELLLTPEPILPSDPLPPERIARPEAQDELPTREQRQRMDGGDTFWDAVIRPAPEHEESLNNTSSFRLD